MILTQCAVCATELGLSLGKKCGRCSTRYCGAACQVQHWKEGGHDTLCKKIKRAGGAEQYNANKKYSEAVAVAVEKCAEDTKGQTCYICTQALHWKTKEGLVRGCSCRGTAGFAHVSCLAEEAKILFSEAEEDNLGEKVLTERWARWHACSLCKQSYHGVVACALGWACWKTYVGRPEANQDRIDAMTELGRGLHEVEHYEDALSVREAELAMLRRLGAPEEDILVARGNLASTYHALGRHQDSMRMSQNVYSGYLRLNGTEHRDTLISANDLAADLVELGCFEEAKSLLRTTMPVARRALGEGEAAELRMRSIYACTLYNDPNATLDDLCESVATLEETTRIARRVFGGTHPIIPDREGELRKARAALRAREGDVDALRDDVEALRVKNDSS